jgi:hypothetical protein
VHCSGDGPATRPIPTNGSPACSHCCTEHPAPAELREILAGRDDGPALLAEVAGVRLGFYEGEPGEPRARAVARFCIAADADESLIPEWIEEGRRRAEAARFPPFSQPGRAPRHS